MSNNDWLDCDKERNALRGRVVDLERQIERAVKVLQRGGPAYADALSTIEMALAILGGVEVEEEGEGNGRAGSTTETGTSTPLRGRRA